MGDLNIKINIENAIEEALKIGRSGNILKDNYNILFSMLFQKSLPIEVIYNEEKIDKRIDEISNKLPGTIVKSSYYIENEELIIKKGKDGLTIEKEKVKNNIKEAIKSTENKTIKIPVKNEKIEKINIEKIHNEIYKEPQNAYITQNPTKVYAHINGVDFRISIEEANKIIE